MPADNSTTNAAVTVAAFVVEKAIGGTRGSVAGLAVQPVVWAVTGTGPDAGDAFILRGRRCRRSRRMDTGCTCHNHGNREGCR